MSLFRSSKILKMQCVFSSVLCGNRHVTTLTGGSECKNIRSENTENFLCMEGEIDQSVLT